MVSQSSENRAAINLSTMWERDGGNSVQPDASMVIEIATSMH